VAILALKVLQVWDMMFSIACNLMAYLSFTTQFLFVANLALKVIQVWDMMFYIACNLMSYYPLQQVLVCGHSGYEDDASLGLMFFKDFSKKQILTLSSTVALFFFSALAI
jgi:hypothetical protein